MEHYICTGDCNGVSQNPGLCQDKSCSKHNKPLIFCDCDTSENHRTEERPKDPQ